MANDPESTRSDASERRIKVDYIKSNYFRIIHADGVFGGLTPSGNIQMELWSERQPIPKQSTYRTVDDGDGAVLGEEIIEARVVRDAYIRELEVGVVFTVDLAKSLIEWLRRRVELMEQATSADEPTSKPDGEKPQ